MIKLGLTGPTGAGKSTVARLLEQNGIPLVDADAIARTVTEKGSPVLSALADTFGKDILFPDGSLDRRALAAVAFSSKENTEKLNAVSHPAILARIRRALADATGDTVVLDAPLLFETGLDALCDHTVAIVADEAVRLARITARDGISEEAAKKRMAVQPDTAFYAARADILLYNNGDRSPAMLASDLLAQIGRWRT